MKKYFSFTFLLLFSFIGKAQQTPLEIKQILEDMNRLVDKSEEYYDTVYLQLNEQIRNTTPVNQAIWHSCMSEFLCSYLLYNEYDIMQRTHISGDKNPDFKTWDMQTMVQEIIYHYQKSIEKKELLQSIAIDEYSVLMDNMNSKEYRPTLYDFLAFQMLNFLNENSIKLPVPVNPFEVNNPQYFANNNIFTNLSIISQDNLSFSYLSLKLMQEITSFHLKNNQILPLIDVTLQRMNYVYENSNLENKDALFIATLQQLYEQYELQLGSGDIAYSIGRYYEERASKYDTVLHRDYRWDYRTAINWYEKAVAQKDTLSARNAQERIDFIKRQLITFATDAVLIPNQQNLISYSFLNCESIFVRIIPVNDQQYEKLKGITPRSQFFEELLRMEYVHQQTIENVVERDFRKHTTDNVLPELPVGKYYILACPKEYSSVSYKDGYAGDFVDVSNIVITYRQNGNQYDFFLLDRKSGAPLKKAKLTVQVMSSYYATSKNDVLSTSTYTSDNNGKVSFNVEKYSRQVGLKVTVQYKKDHLTYKEAYSTYIYHYYRENTTSSSTDRVQLFTDRAIYRPGQTVYYKGILLKEQNGKHNIIPDKKVTVELYDANGQKVDEVDAKSNEYGSFAGSFELPKSGRTGGYSIKVLNNYAYVVVEEYKRPQFEITLQQPEDSYRLNETVSVKGEVMAYAGYAIDGAAVKYRVVRQTSFPFARWWFPFSYTPDQEIIQGNVTTKKDGSFVIDFVAKPGTTPLTFKPLYQYRVMVDVTDINGETQSISTTIPVGTVSMFLTLDMPDEIEIGNGKSGFEISANNWSNKPQAVQVDYKVMFLETPASYRHAKQSAISDVPGVEPTAFPHIDLGGKNRKELWKELQVVATGSVNTSTDSCLNLQAMSTWDEGYYKIILTSKDHYGEEVTLEKIVLCYNANSKKCPAYEPVWIYTDKQTASSGEPVTFTIGSYLKNANILVEFISNDSVIKREWITLNQSKKTYSFIAEEGSENLKLHAYLCSANYFYEKTETITIKEKNENIVFEWITFRDKTLPGSKEEYRLRLKGADGEKIAGELLCSMYDASLDAFASNKFQFNLYSRYKRPWNYRLSGMPSALNVNYQNHSHYPREEFKRYYSLNWDVSLSSRYYRAGGVSFMDEMAVESPRAKGNRVTEEEVSYSDQALSSDVNESIVMDEATQESVPIRSNFVETAFFYPFMQTDENGDITISFTLPESLTKWKIKGAAHTKELRTGLFERFVQTQKPLMVVPNAPRFFREKDTLFFTAKVVNMSNEPISGKVSIQFFNALTGEELSMVVENNKESFVTEKGQSANLQFKLSIPSNVEAITYRIVASSDHATVGENGEKGKFSDGEEKTLPVLSNRMLVTESMPLAITGAGQKTFVFDKLKNNTSKTLSNYKYTLEFTSNPVWYAVLSLPYMMEYPYECSEQIFSRMYANAIASHIANSSPKIKQIFESWKNTSPDAFYSNLEKNEELKNIVLEESPWLMDAQKETAANQRVGELFDTKRLAEEQKRTINKLMSQQSNAGSWSWFNGGQPSLYITQHIVAGFGHLQTLGISTITDNEPIEKAIYYIDSENNKRYFHLKDNPKTKMEDLQLSSLDIHYLYARSFYIQDYKIASSHKEMYDYYLKQAGKYWSKQTLYAQAMIALALHRTGDEITAKRIISSIKSKAQYSQEIGMYWKKEGNGWYWYEAPLERQAILIEAFSLITPDDEPSVEKMQQWLLKQKQTQNWGTTKATAAACYALLLRGQEPLQTESDVVLTVGKEKIAVNELPETQAGTGYFKTSWKENEVTKEMATVTVNKPSKGTSWGGVYWQYFEDLNKITAAQSPLSIQKKLYRVDLNERGETLSLITEKETLRVGDKVRVRIEIRADRDMEYVHLKDMRASAFEPVNVFSQYKSQGSLWYYESTRDASSNFFFDYLPKGTYVFEYTLIATQAGSFSNGIGTLQCMYAPEFSAHSEGLNIVIEK